MQASTIITGNNTDFVDKKKKIKIFWASGHCCIRVIKQATALMKTGRYEICGAAHQVSYGTQYFDSFCFYHNKKQFDNLVRNSDADIFIWSNEPCGPLNWIRAIKPDAKIILDAHDMDSVRSGVIPLEEMRAISNCDAITFVSAEVQSFVTKLHKSQLNGKPTIVLEHYCNEEYIQDGLPSEQRRGLVYQGGAQSPPYKNKQFKYRHLYPIMKQLVDQGHELHIMTGNPDATISYSNMGAFTYEPQVYPDLMKKLLSKRWGLCIFNNQNLDQPQVNLTRTNKEQEYLACGLPIIVFGAPATAKWVKEHEVGLCFDKLEDITPKILEKEYSRVKTNVEKIKPGLTMENHIDVVEKLIAQLIESQ